MKKTLKKGSLLLFIATMLMLASCAKKGAEMSFEEEEYDFGTIVQGQKVTHDFKFTNTGTADLVITDAKGSCGCTVPLYPKEAIKPNASGIIKVSFDSTGKMDEVHKTVTLMSNSSEYTQVLNIKANIQEPEKAK